MDEDQILFVITKNNATCSLNFRVFSVFRG